MNDITSKTIVLIAGQSKAGTTSLFDWLSQHPDVAAGKLKELRFWLDKTYPLQSPSRYDGENLGDYLSLFNNSERSILVDASPDYIACAAPLKIPEIHANSKAIIIVRDPVERMVSAYRFFQSRGLVTKSMSFDDYIEKQLKEGVHASTPVQYRALDHCRVGHYLPLWQSAYGDNLLILSFEDLQLKPNEVFDEVLAFLGLQGSVEIKINHKNKTQESQFPVAMRVYNATRRWMAMKTIKYPTVYLRLRAMGGMISGQATKVKSESGFDVILSDRSRAIISKISDKNR